MGMAVPRAPVGAKSLWPPQKFGHVPSLLVGSLPSNILFIMYGIVIKRIG